MQGKRTDRVAHLIQMELSQRILTQLKDPGIGFVTITRVEVTPDLRIAYVYFSVLGDSEKKKESLKALRKSAGFLQREISGVMQMKFTPKLDFRIDDSLEKGLEIDETLRKIKENGS